MKFIDLTGNRYNRLLVLHRDPDNDSKKIKWVCQCDCGNIKSITGNDLKSGDTQSCGCLSAEKHKLLFTTHNLSQSPEYGVYSAMLARCYNQNVSNFQNYGGRGIQVCNRWKESFENFYSDMGPRPSDNHSIDRRDNNGDYSPDNCRWVTTDVQNSNRRNTVKVEYMGEKITLRELSNKTDISFSTLATRYYRGEVDISAPLQNHNLVEYNGVMDTIGGWARRFNIPYKILHQRLARGWTLERALHHTSHPAIKFPPAAV